MKKVIISSICFVIILMTISMNSEKMPMPGTKSFLALGDSYTIGEGVVSTQTWPVLLTKELNKKGYPVSLPKIIAKTGWRTDNLITAIQEENSSDKFDLVSVLIGVNNQFQGKSIDIYKKDLRSIFNSAIGFCSQGKEGVFVLSIPDYGSTPFGKIDTESIGREIDEWNAACKSVCEEFGIRFFDITPISKKAVNDPSLLAKDGLHPSGKMYAMWVEKIVDDVILLVE